jgi:hypothetical protein
LAPSVIGHYDRLSDSFKNDTVIGELRVKKSPERNIVDESLKKLREQSPKPKLIVSKIPTKPTQRQTTTSLKFNSNQHIQNPSTAASKNLQIISPNVHRMISSHQTTTETITAASPSVKSFINSLNKTRNQNLSNRKLNNLNPQGQRILLKNNNNNNLPKTTNFAIPLTKNLSKFSQSSVDSSERIIHTITDDKCNSEDIIEKLDSEKTPTNCDHNFNYDNSCLFNEDDDDDIQNVLNRTSELINNLLSGSGNCDFKSFNSVNTLDGESQEKNSSCVNIEDNNDKMKSNKSRHKYTVHQHNSESDEDIVACEAVNTNLKVTKSLDNVNRNDFKPSASPKLSYSRATLLSNQPTDNSPTQSPKLSADKRLTASSDGKLNASPSSKHRPLSAASISSSASSTSTASSSNSFGAENLSNGKLPGVTYLASIESLADHSENEAITSLTMCERAALEIIESEKSYVEDLGQIIRG